MVFVIQNTQSRDAKAIQLKLDELIRVVRGARTGLVRLEELSDEDLRTLADEFEKLRARRVVQTSHVESGEDPTAFMPVALSRIASHADPTA